MSGGPTTPSSSSSSIKWVTPEIRLSVATSLHDDTPMEINFANTIGYRKHVTKTLAENEAYWLFSHTYNQNTPAFRASVLAPPFVEACKRAGFVVMMKEHTDQLPGNRSKTLFCCNRFRFHKPRQQGKRQRQQQQDNIQEKVVAGTVATPTTTTTRTSQRAIKGQEETCGFKFNVYWDETRKRWFVPKKQAGSIEHRGHVPLPPDQVKISYRVGFQNNNTNNTTNNNKGGKEEEDRLAVNPIAPPAVAVGVPTTTAEADVDSTQERAPPSKHRISKNTQVVNQVDNYYQARIQNKNGDHLPPRQTKRQRRAAASAAATKTTPGERKGVEADDSTHSHDDADNNPPQNNNNNNDSYYCRLLPIYNDITNCIQTEDDFEECQHMMKDVLTKMKKAKQQQEQQQEQEQQASSNFHNKNDDDDDDGTPGATYTTIITTNYVKTNTTTR